MKKIIILLLAVVMCLPLVACGGNNTTSEETTPEVTTPEETTPEITTPEVTIPEETTEPEPEIPVVQVKETVSTDIIDLTLEHSKLTYYVSNVHSTYVKATDEPNTLFAARMGTCYVSMTVTITNKDRGGSFNFPQNMSPTNWIVTYNDEEYPIYGFDLNNPKSNYISLSYAALVDRETGSTIRKNDTGSILIRAGETCTIRFFGIIEVDPVSLDDGFALTVRVPNSSGERELYTYNIPPVNAGE